MSTCAELDEILHDDSLSPSARMVSLGALVNVEDCIELRLRNAVAGGDWDEFELYLLAAYKHPSSKLTTSLCAALDQRDRRVPYEDALEVLAEVADPAAIETLAGLLRWMPEWDEYHSIAVKTVWAIAAIDTPAANGLLAEAAEDSREVVRDWAKGKLGRA